MATLGPWDIPIGLAARIVKIARVIPDKSGKVPGANATNEELWQHANRVALRTVLLSIRHAEQQLPDADFDQVPGQ